MAADFVSPITPYLLAVIVAILPSRSPMETPHARIWLGDATQVGLTLDRLKKQCSTE